MITVDNLAVEFGGTTLFSEVSFAINPTDKIALMGKNGAGKSTMMKIIAGVHNRNTRPCSGTKGCHDRLSAPAFADRGSLHRF